MSIPLTEQKGEFSLKKDKFSQYNKIKHAYILSPEGVRSLSMPPQEGGLVVLRDFRGRGVRPEPSVPYERSRSVRLYG